MFCCVQTRHLVVRLIMWCVQTPCVQTHQTACTLGQSTWARREAAPFWEFVDVKRVLQTGCATHRVLDEESP